MDPKNIERAAIYTLIIILSAALIAGAAALVVHFSRKAPDDPSGSNSQSEMHISPENTQGEPENTLSTPETQDNNTAGTDEGTNTAEPPAETETSFVPVKVTTYDEPKTMYAMYNTNARESYTTASVILGMFYQGDEITVIGQTDNGWYQVKYGTYKAYIRADLLTDKKEEAETTIKVYKTPKIMYTTGEINIRRSHTTNSELIATVPLGTEITVTGETDNGWYQVKYNDEEAYIKSDLLTSTKPSADSPAETNQPA